VVGTVVADFDLSSDDEDEAGTSQCANFQVPIFFPSCKDNFSRYDFNFSSSKIFLSNF
jgi:hypothetical protein